MSLFTPLAAHYDLLNRLMSLGRDRHWRRRAAAALHLPPGSRVLDVGAGTGDLSLALLHRWRNVEVVGLDPAVEMMDIGRKKPRGSEIRWVRGNGLRLPFPTASFDGVASAFLLRNVPDVPTVLAEQARVLRPGGRLVCLEMTWPQNRPFAALFRLYFAGLMPFIAGTLTGRWEAYRYLPRSVEHFMRPDALQVLLEQVGIRAVRYRLLMLGTVTLHWGVKENGRG